MRKPPPIPTDLWAKVLAAHPFEGPRLREAVAHAIMAETERCAKLAEEFAGQFPEYPEFDEQHNCAIYIASVIRGKADVNTVSKNSVEG